MTTYIIDVPIEKIKAGRNPRTKFDPEKLQELAQSIQERGQHQPIVLEPHKDGYLLIMGERRLRAHKLLGRRTIKAYIREQSNHNGRERFLDALVENDQREDMTAMDRARAYQVLQLEYGMSVRQISIKTGTSEPIISNLMLLTKLDSEIQDLIDEGLWHDPRFVRGLLQIDDKATRIQLAEHLWKHRLSLKGCLNAVGRTHQIVGAMKKAKKLDARKGSPARQLAEAELEPRKWGMLRQLGKLPAWELVVHAADQTCDTCPLRSMASQITCEECGAVAMLRKMMESANV